MTKKEFSDTDKKKMLLWCDRHCCLCGKNCGGFIAIHHIESNEDSSIDNGIPLCLECHGLVHGQKESPIGTKFKTDELKTRRDQIYRKHTAYLVPVIHFEISQAVQRKVASQTIISKRSMPDVGFNITHTGGAFPVKARVHIEIFLGSKKVEDFSKKENNHYNGKRDWNLNPGITIIGHFNVPSEAVSTSEQLKVRVEVTVIDAYDYHHKLLPLEYIFIRGEDVWYVEP